MPGVLDGRTIVVTGAALGLGRAMTLGLAQAGANVGALDLASGRDAMDTLVAAADELGVRAKLLPVFADVRREPEVQAAVDQVAAHFGSLYGLVNNAGRGMQDIGPVQVMPRKKFYEVPSDVWRDVIDVNLVGAFIVARCVAPRLVAAGRGRIVNVVTSFCTMQTEGFSPYGPSKAGLEAATVIWAKDLAFAGVTVNAILPGGAADTRMIPAHEILDRTTLVQPEAMAAPIVWLMSEAAATVTGTRITAQSWDARQAAAPAGFPY